LNGDALRILIAAEHASARFGGEAALPLHYFRVLRGRGMPVWLVTHARTRDELSRLYPDDPCIVYIEDTAWHRAMWRIGQRLPAQISYFTTGFLSRLSTQLAQRRVVRRLVKDCGIDVIHQPMPVSPREPSMLFGFGVPVVIGPMNGGMDYPPAFRRQRGAIERRLLGLGRASATALNLLMPGKRRAAALLVANQRSREALPGGVCKNVIELVENGVDLGLWKGAVEPAPRAAGAAATFAFMGRLVDWKAVDLLLRAFDQARRQAPMRLWILGDGPERAGLEALAATLGILGPDDAATDGTVHFAGWLAQAACAERIQQADGLVLPSLLECGGAVVLEAMSMGKPVIATAWGGPLDYLDASCGVLVTPDSRAAIVDRFAQAMVDLARSAPLRQQMGRRGLRKVLGEYDWELKVDRVLQIYRSVQRRGQA
jgi:glycosyltransferase involved in cell wall biosynthesis